LAAAAWGHPVRKGGARESEGGGRERVVPPLSRLETTRVALLVLGRAVLCLRKSARDTARDGRTGFNNRSSFMSSSLG